MSILFWLSVFVVFEAMIGYPLTLIIADKILKPKENEKKKEYEPTVTLMIVAHDEEKVIGEKLRNAIEIDYPIQKYKILVASDNSKDKTNKIVKLFIDENREYDIRLYNSVNHYGKTNAQNEAQKLVNTEILVMTDANAMLKKDAIKELVSSFSGKDIAYVTGRLKYINTEDNNTAASEGLYWSNDLKCRDIESKLQTITAGNGAIYAVRNKDYIDVEPIECHDSAFPILYAINGKRAIYNKDAVAYEKAGEIDKEEFDRKARTSRLILKKIMPDVRIINIFKMKWFSYFYFGHRTCRYLLWIAHIIALISNILLYRKSILYKGTMFFQGVFFLLGILGLVSGTNNKLVRAITYYLMTVFAQLKAVYNILTGKSKSTWEKAVSTR